MSDPGTTYRTREEIQRMRSTQDPIRGLAHYIEQWGLATEEDLKVRKFSSLTHVAKITHQLSSLFNSKSKRNPRLKSTRLLRRPRLRQNLKQKTSGRIFITRALSRLSCVVGSVRRWDIFFLKYMCTLVQRFLFSIGSLLLDPLILEKTLHGL